MNRRSTLELPKISMGDSIPLIIHQTYRSKIDIPAEILNNVKHLKQQNPTYTHRLYDDNDIESFILSEYNQEIYELYKRISPEYGAARADLFRYLLIYRIGGVYLDIKSTTSRPLAETIRLSDRYLLSHWDNSIGDTHEGWGRDADYAGLPQGEFQQWHIAAVPGHPFLAAVIQQVLKNIVDYSPWKSGVGRLATLNTFGPVCYTKTIQPLLNSYPHRIVKTQHDIGLQYSCLANKLAHRALSPTYYRQNVTPLVKPYTFYERILSRIFIVKTQSRLLRFGRRIQSRLRRR